MTVDLHSVPALHSEQFSLSLFELLAHWKSRGALNRLLQQTIEEQIILTSAKQQGLQASDQELQEAADSFRQQNHLQQAAEMQSWLEARQLSVQDFEQGLELTILRVKLAEKVIGEQIDRFFAENQSRFEHAQVSQIVVEREGMAEELLSQIQEDGKDFAVLARKHSEDDNSRLAGGYLGAMPRDALNSSEIEAAVFGAKPGTVLGPFKTAQGFHLIHVAEIIPAQLNDRTRDAIREHLFEQWLADQVKHSSVQENIWQLFSTSGS